MRTKGMSQGKTIPLLSRLCPTDHLDLARLGVTPRALLRPARDRLSLLAHGAIVITSPGAVEGQWR